MSVDNWTKGSLTLSGQEIPVRIGFMPVIELKFYTENPRLYSIVCREETEPSQEFIEKKLASMEHVKQLVQSIRANGGLTDPLIVREGDNTVLEGNSRLAAYRLLGANDPIKWGRVKCTLLPKDITDAQVFALLGEYHIIGKKDWQPFEQAGYLYRRCKNYGVEQATIANEMGLSLRKVAHLIKVYSFMVEHGDDDITRWSYYDEFLKHRAISLAREEIPMFDSAFVSKVKNGEIEKAIDVREKVVLIATAGGRILKNFVEVEGSLEKCHERAIEKGADNVWLKRLGKFKELLAEEDLKNLVTEMSEDHRKKCLYEIKKITQVLNGVLAKWVS
jgi:hypothetical protein